MGELNQWTKRGLNTLSHALVQSLRARAESSARRGFGQWSFRILDQVRNVPEFIPLSTEDGDVLA